MQVSTTSNQMSPKMEYFFSRIFPLIFIVAGGSILFFGIFNIIKANNSEHWPRAEGMILSSSVEGKRSTSSSTSTYHAYIRYKFNVKNVVFNGTKISYGDYGSSDSSHATKIVSKYPKNKNITVYYNDNNPEECVLEPGLKGQAFLLPGIGLILVIIGSLMAIFIPKAMKITKHST